MSWRHALAGWAFKAGVMAQGAIGTMAPDVVTPVFVTSERLKPGNTGGGRAADVSGDGIIDILSLDVDGPYYALGLGQMPLSSTTSLGTPARSRLEGPPWA